MHCKLCTTLQFSTVLLVGPSDTLLPARPSARPSVRPQPSLCTRTRTVRLIESSRIESGVSSWAVHSEGTRVGGVARTEMAIPIAFPLRSTSSSVRSRELVAQLVEPRGFTPSRPACRPALRLRCDGAHPFTLRASRVTLRLQFALFRCAYIHCTKYSTLQRVGVRRGGGPHAPRSRCCCLCAARQRVPIRLKFCCSCSRVEGCHEINQRIKAFRRSRQTDWKSSQTHCKPLSTRTRTPYTVLNSAAAFAL